MLYRFGHISPAYISFHNTFFVFLKPRLPQLTQRVDGTQRTELLYCVGSPQYIA